MASTNFQDLARYPPIPQPGAGDEKIKVEVVGPDNTEKMTDLQQQGSFRKNGRWSPTSKDVPEIDAFYFRLSGLNLYFTESKGDMVVLGAIAISNVEDVDPNTMGGACFKVMNKEFDEWDLCTVKPEEKKLWVCPIFKALKRKCPLEDDKPKVLSLNQGTVIEKIKYIKQPLILIPLPSPDCRQDWEYTNHGSDWKCRCNEGVEQSPINLPKHDSDDVEPLQFNAIFDWNEVKKDQVKVIYRRNVLRIRPLSPEVNLGQLTDIEGSMFRVKEIRFHTPSEHQIKGKKFDLEVQIMHECIQGDYKDKAVVSFLYKKKAGAKIRFFEELDILNLPGPSLPEAENIITGNFNIWKFLYDEEDLVRPPPFNYYRYRGSFTTPPCEENVIWFVAQVPLNLSLTTIQFIKDSIVPLPTPGAEEDDNAEMPSNYDGNNRLIQKLRDRVVQFYDREKSCSPYVAPKRVD